MATIREIASSPGNTSTSTQVTCTGAVQSTDQWVVITGNDYYQSAAIPTPTTSGSGTFTAILAEVGAATFSSPQIRAWTAACTGGAETLTLGLSIDCIAFVITGYTGVNASAGNFDTTTTAHVCPTVSGVAGGLLICAVESESSVNIDYDWTGSGMTEQAEVDYVPYSTMSAATEVLSSGGATGTRTTTASAARRYAALSLVLNAAATTSPPRPPVLGGSSSAVQRALW